MQCFREQYKLEQDNLQVGGEAFVEEGIRLIRGYMEQQPGNILSIDYVSNEGHYIFVFDYAAFNPDAVDMPKDWKIFMGGTYYMFQLMNSNLQATRQGIALIGECDGMGFHNYNSQLENRWMNELCNYFPLKHKESLWLNSPMVANIIYDAIKPFMTAELKRGFHLGCKLDGYDGRIDQLYKMPTPEAAQEVVIARMAGFLRERNYNVATYRLPLRRSGCEADVTAVE